MFRASDLPKYITFEEFRKRVFCSSAAEEYKPTPLFNGFMKEETQIHLKVIQEIAGKLKELGTYSER
jgi:hypothetical protein